MRYWVYINDKVEGPFTEDKLVTLQGFTPDTLICSEDAANSGNQEWVKASTIFEFDQIEPTPSTQPAANLAQEPTAETTTPPAQNTEALAAALLAKLDSLTNQLSEVQSKLDGMQVKLDESISAQQKASDEAAERAEALAAQVDSFATLSHPDSHTDDNPFTQTDSLSQDSPAAAPLPDTEALLETPNSIDLDAYSAAEEPTANQLDDDAVLNAALTSLHNKETAPAPSQDADYTIQDLLHPEESQTLETPQPEQTPTENVADNKPQPSSEEDAAKEAVLAELTSPAASEEVVDQIIKEKEAEQKQEADKKDSLSKRLIAAGAAAASAAATFVGLKAKTEDNTVQNEPESSAAITQEQPQETAAQAQTKPSAEQDVPPQETATPEVVTTQEALSPLPTEQHAEPEQQEQPAAAPDLQPVTLDNPEAAPATTAEPEPLAQEDIYAIPSLQESAAPVEDKPKEQPVDDSAIQELVPGAATEQNEPGALISEADLREAFADRAPETQSVEQLFGIGETPSQETNATNTPAPEQDLSSLGETEELPGLDEATPTAPAVNPNELTEIELKEGSTYLISDFVPPASSDAIEQAYAKRDGKTIPPVKENTSAKPASKTESIEIQEFVSTPKNISQEPEQPVSKEAEATVTVSQVVLENTIKPKRGAALDIKTVPMVPEPAQSDRLQIDGLEDDINTQHDLKEADIKPAGKTAKMVVGSLIALLLAGVIYGMLGFMELIPAKFNILAPKEEVATAEQEAQLDEMLGPSDMPATAATTDGADQTVAPQNTQDIVLQEVQNYMLANGYSLKQYIELKHPTMVDAITWTISSAVDPDTYSVLVKVPPENPQSFKTSYRFNYNAVSRTLEPTISDARNLLNSVNQPLPRK